LSIPSSFLSFFSLPVDRVREELGHDLGRALERDGVARGGRLEGHCEAEEGETKEKKGSFSFGERLSSPRKKRRRKD
jgi:hypothetical protein